MNVLFEFSIQSFTDVITNSSSELFVFNNGSIDQVISLLNMIYPDWRTEYEEPIMVKDMDNGSLERYLYNVFSSYDLNIPMSKETSNQCIIARKLKIAFKDLYSNWDDFDPTIPYPFRDDFKTEKSYKKAREYYNNKHFLKLKPNWIDIVRPKLGNFNNNICLYSLKDNPNWDFQEVIQQYATRYHLG